MLKKKQRRFCVFNGSFCVFNLFVYCPQWQPNENKDVKQFVFFSRYRQECCTFLDKMQRKNMKSQLLVLGPK